MDGAHESMIISCGPRTEKIIIEKNGMCSDDSEMSDSSSCWSYSGFEEIEVGPSLNAEKRGKSHPNPYVKLVRCDHLVGKVLSGQNFKRTENKFIRSSPRIRRQNDTCVCDVFQLYDILNKKQGRRNSSMGMNKKLNVKCVNSSCNNSDYNSISNDVTKFSTNLLKRKARTINYVNNKVNHTSISNDCFTLQTDSTKNTKQEYLNDGDYDIHNVNSCLQEKTEYVNGNTFNHNVFGINTSGETLNSAIKEEPQNIVIKEEQYDEYFDINGNEFASNFSRTSYNRSVYPGEFQNVQTKTFVKHESDYIRKTPENNCFNPMNYKPMVNGNLSDVNAYTVIKQENITESSDSDVDVEKEWNESLFTVHQNNVAFDHSYALTHEMPYPIKLISNKASNEKRIVQRKRKQKTHSLTKPITTIIKRKNIVQNSDDIQNSVQKSCDIQNRVQNSHETQKKPKFDNHNILERLRRSALRKDYSSLRDEIPSLHGLELTPKIIILRKAILYITFLKDESKSLVEKLKEQTDKHDELKKRFNKAMEDLKIIKH